MNSFKIAQVIVMGAGYGGILGRESMQNQQICVF